MNITEELAAWHDDLALAASEGFPDPMADELENIAARLHSNIIDIQLVARRSRLLARKRWEKRQRQEKRQDAPRERSAQAG